MAFFPIDRNAASSNNILELKSILVRGLAVAEQLQRETAEMTEIQMQAQYGITATTAQWDGVLNGVVTAIQAAAIDTYISSVG